MNELRHARALALWTTSTTLVVCSALGWLGADFARTAPAAELASNADGLHGLSRELAGLRSEITQLEAALRDQQAFHSRVLVAADGQARDAAPRPGDVRAARVAADSEQRSRLSSAAEPDASVRAIELGKLASDASRTPEERVEALRRLRALDVGDAFPGGDARTPEVVQSLLDSILNSRDTSFQVEVIQNLSGARHELLRDPLLHFLQTSAEPRVREEAAETLRTQLGDPLVVDLLRWTAESDPSERVRLQARRTLSKLPRARPIEGR
jgi:hypothetical protein